MRCRHCLASHLTTNCLRLVPAFLWEWRRFNSRESGNEKCRESRAPGKREPGNENTSRDPFSFAPRYALVSSHNVQCQQYPCCLITWLYRAKCTQTAFWHNRGSKRCHMRWRTFYSLQINVIDSPLEICDEARSLSTAFSSLIFSLWSIKLVGLL